MTNPIDWKFSSARNYGNDDHTILEIDINQVVCTSETLAPSGDLTSIYAGNYIYEKDNSGEKLSFFSHPEGYIEKNGAGYDYVYQYKDHLGNVRLSYKNISTTGVNLQIVEENNYYPFGLKMKGFNNVVNGRDHKYGYGNKEEQDELGLEWIDITARNYDSALGRWMVIDALSDHENQVDKSPYAYAWNNPISLNDPDGNCPKCPGGFAGRVGFNIGFGNQGMNFNMTASVGYEYRTENFQSSSFLSLSTYMGNQLGTSSQMPAGYDITLGSYATVGNGSGSAHTFNTLNYNTPSPIDNTFDTSISYGQMLTYNSAINSQGDGPGIQIRGLVGLRVGDNFSLSTSNDSSSAPYFSRILRGGESTDAGWTGSLTMNIGNVQLGYENFTGYREGLYPGGGVGTKYAQTSFQQSLNSASNFLQIGGVRGEYSTTGWLQNLIHNFVSEESTYNYDNTNNFNVSGGTN